LQNVAKNFFEFKIYRGTVENRAMPNHALNFDGVLWQHIANQRDWFYIENPPVCTIVAFKGPILKI
jgi:hypothetical protein